nr:GreA/GreB family elongation factor [Candidatus Enterousia merdequi]
MKTFVTKEYLKLCTERIAKLQADLDRIRLDKKVAFEGDTNAWHDNFAYENATREEKLAEDRLFQAVREVEIYYVFSDVVPNKPTVVGIYCWVKVREENIVNTEIRERTIGVVPVGGQDHKKALFSYNAPIVSPLMGAKVGEKRVVKIPLGTFRTEILDIQKMR